MVEAGEDLALALEPGDDDAVGTRRQTLQGDRALGGTHLAGQVHLAARARGHQATELVAGEASPGPPADGLPPQSVEQCTGHAPTLPMLSTLVYA